MTLISFPQQHGTMLLKYAGISFISGAVNHGFFSETRSLWTAAIGMTLFVLGAWLEHRLCEKTGTTQRSGLLPSLVLGALLSIGLGFFTGGLQHFPDSPARSAWVVPLGFLVSVLALALSTPLTWQRTATAYVLMLGGVVSLGSWGAWQWLEKHPEWTATGHSHDSHTTSSDDMAPPDTTALVVSRSVTVRMDDQMRFTPNHIAVQTGETIRFVVHNAGRTAHEMVLGSNEAIGQHAEAMRQGTGHEVGHSHGTGAAITVAAGGTGELVVHFAQAVQLQMACLIPGHYEAGMRGTLTVNSAAHTTDAPKPAPPHDHASHTH